MRITTLIHENEGGGYWAEVPYLRGCVTQGDTMEEIVANLQEAMEGWLDVSGERMESDVPEYALNTKRAIFNMYMTGINIEP